MNNDYADIREGMLPREPEWWDEHAVPRYCEFSPDVVSDIYADEVILFEITCQGCGRKFLVADSRAAWRDRAPLSAEIKDKAIHYGDPPNIGCCASGPTMNSEPRRVVEYWHRSHMEHTRADPDLAGAHIVTDVAEYFRWRRDPKLEIDITPDWVSVSAV
jgi:hypothetical protein